jgi:hypothetical protein
MENKIKIVLQLVGLTIFFFDKVALSPVVRDKKSAPPI